MGDLEATCVRKSDTPLTDDSGDGARRRTQRAGIEAAQIIRIETRTTSCLPYNGRPGLTECQEPAFERCHQEACAPILQGHRRAQVGPQACTAQDLQARTTAVHLACCPGDECSSGHPGTCSAACADVFLPWWEDCEVALGKDGRQFEQTVALCEAADGTSVSIAMQLGVECSDGTPAAECVPECTEQVHGFLMLLNIEGEDSKLSCELHHGLARRGEAALWACSSTAGSGLVLVVQLEQRWSNCNWSNCRRMHQSIHHRCHAHQGAPQHHQVL